MCPCENMTYSVRTCTVVHGILFGLASECRQINWRYKTFVITLHCTLESGMDLRVKYSISHKKIKVPYALVRLR